jgi:hypothetical protein
VDKDANIPDITFSYGISAGSASDPDTDEMEIMAGPTTGVTVGTAAFTSADTASATAGTPSASDTEHKYASKNVTVTFPANIFTKPGVYRYKITQNEPGTSGVTYDANEERYPDVFVVDNAGTLSVNTCKLTTAATTIDPQTGATNTTYNNAKSSGYTNEITQYDLIFNKVITGNQGDKNKVFDVTLSVSNAVPGTYVVQTTDDVRTTDDATEKPTTITITAGGSQTVTYKLTNGSQVKIIGLNSGAKYTISEDNDDYTATYKINSGTAQNGNTTSEQTLSANTTVEFTNTRNGIIPTGIIIAIAPYVIGLCLFGAVVIFMLGRKKRQSAEEN